MLLTGCLLTACGGNGGLGESQFNSCLTSIEADASIVAPAAAVIVVVGAESAAAAVVTVVVIVAALVVVAAAAAVSVAIAVVGGVDAVGNTAEETK